MNFLMRSSSHVHVERTPPIQESSQADTPQTTSGTSLETLISEDPYSRLSTIEEFDGENGSVSGKVSRKDALAKHVDVSEEEGWIAIPCKELPKSWNDVSDIRSLHSLDRSFLFPGEQIQIVACLSACKQDTEIITPFKVAAVMSKSGIGHSPEKQNGNIEDRNNSASGEGQISSSSQEQKEESLTKPKADVSAGESLLRMEVHKRQTALLLQRFENSHFFVRISESDEPLWSKRSSSENSSSSDVSSVSAIIDRGNFDANISGGVARNSVKCFALPNGDIVVLLQVNVGVNFLRDPCIEILQYEKYQDNAMSPQTQGNSVNMSQDQCGELLMWLLPLDNTLSTPSRPSSPTKLPSSTGTGSASHRHNYSASSGSQSSFFGHFRSYSMSSLPQNTTLPPAAPVKAASSKPNFDMEDWDQISSHKLRKKNDVEELLSFRGVSLERERFSICCGLEGIYTPGRRWRRKLEIIQPVEIHSFAADCNTDDLLCIQIKNVAPADAPDIVIFIDAITIVFDEATKSGLPSSLPISCIEVGNDHSLPNLVLRRGEEHSFILKPATWKNLKVQDETNSQLSKSHSGSSASSLNSSPQSVDRRKASLNDDQYAIVVSCRCNYTTSQLFFKQPTSWRPRTSRDILISVSSEMSGESPEPYARNSPLPVQVLTLQASNFTSEDLTLTVLAPASFTSLPSVVSLNSPTSSMSPFVGFTEFLGRVSVERHNSATQGQSFSPLVKENEKPSNHGAPRSSSTNDVIPSSGLSCTHLWLQSRVPLGCVPSQSTATIKLELLPLTDGIITLDSLQINVKEKGVAYIPECSLKINATTSISKGIV
ncbi:hypothetical protein PIB30_039543 [Stylosanthes scabra]|uniref:Uncharacterized protein n=1 Tax=Stylosanthes scabra TaxID=79078 RepID=A0ABU6SE68_9FABA|nr:hypothetical protein [Stylosanthes scabra]